MSRFDDAPDRYWHCMVGTKESTWFPTLRDQTKQEILDKFVEPWRKRRPIIVGSTVFRDHDLITTLKITQTDERAKHYQDTAFGKGNPGFAYAEFHEGNDFTAELLGDALAAPTVPDDLTLLLQLCARLHLASKPLAIRRQSKPLLVIQDEYDAQDLLHALVRAYFKYSVSEQPIKKLANAKSTRADFAIEDLGVLVELKYVHGPADQQRIVKELAEDLLHYEQWVHLKAVIYVVYNAADLQDPEALDKLSGMRSVGDRKYDVYIVRT